MPRHRPANFTPRRRTPNRSWTGAVDSVIVGGPGEKDLLASFALSNSNIDETVLRVVGVISVFSDSVAGGEDQEGAFGMIRVSDNAITAGAASIPGPITDIGDDGWFVHVPFIERTQFLDATGFIANSGRRYTFDFKSKRTVEDGFAIALMQESSGSSEGYQFHIILRMLSMVRGTG